MKILLVHTGGTIGSEATPEARVQNADTVDKAKRYLTETFEKSSPYANSVEIADAEFPSEQTTLSESMTVRKLGEIARFVREKAEENKYSGVILLHGTDTLAFTASVFSFLFAGVKIPLFLVSGNRPPEDEKSNALANFTAAAELIYEKIPPNVYVTYRNSDGLTRLYLGSCIMQSPNFSEDFFSGKTDKMFELNAENKEKIIAQCGKYSENRKRLTDISNFKSLSDRVLLINPHPGLDYSLYESALDKNSENLYLGVVHSTYHSGTVSYPGLVLLSEAEKYRKAGKIKEAEEYERAAKEESQSRNSIYYLSELCKKNGVPLYIAPSALGEGQYATMNAVKENTVCELLDMTTESAYAKLTVALSYGMTPEEISEYMNTEVNNEL